MRTIIILLLSGSFLLAATGAAPAQATPAGLTIPAAAQRAADPAAATRAWLASVPADKREKSDAYFEGGYWLILWDFLLGAVISIFLLSSGLSARLRDFAERTTRVKVFQVVLYAIPYIVIVAVLSFPLGVYSGYFREHAYGLATQTFGPWFREQLIGLAVTIITSTILLVVLYAVFRRARRTWWLWGTGVGVVFLVLGMLLAPIFIEPLFNTYKPLTDPKISGPILAMAAANEIPVHQVFEVDASRQSNRVSANVAGIFGTARIALNDNLLKQCTLPEIRAVMAHEMGHYVLNHAIKLVLYFSVFLLIGFVLVSAFFDRCLRRWGERWQVRGIADPAGLPLLALIFSTYFFLLTPLMNTAVRVTEREADAFGINTAREADGEAKVALKLGAYRKLNPGPVEEFIFFDHPSGRARIRMAMDWKAANLPAGDAGTGAPASR
ncbi:MAG: M48 family metallopeptidase [Chthoniobacterales bacterium]|nr:M48 family metallopeptidase [Chthoniobacterales bacterium]